MTDERAGSDDADQELARDRRRFADSSIARIFPILRNGIWHTTGPWAMRSMLATDQIRPNHREFPYSFPQTANSYGFYKGYVCLFDFGVVAEPEYVRFYERWAEFFERQKPFTVAIELDRAALGEKLVPNDVAKREVGYKKVWIPYVEAWHIGPISLASCARQYVLIDSPNRLPRITRFGPSDPEFAEVIDRAAAETRPPASAAVRPRFETTSQEWEHAGGRNDSDD